MFLRKLAVCSSLLAVALISAPSVANADDNLPIVRDTCAEPALVRRQVGHPGKSLMQPGFSLRNCSVDKPKSKPLVLAGFTDVRGGLALVRGKPQRALDQIYGRNSVRPTGDELTNLCVAHTRLQQWGEASDACDAAVGRATDARARASRSLSAARKLADTKLAVAYSNRAVLYRLTGDAVAAHNDLAKARKISPNASFVVRNVEAAGREPSLARVAP